jgi:TatA/E family protein of Tat protein translocase
MLGTSELLIVLVIVLVLFGSTRLPALMEGLGKGLRAFKKASNGEDEVNLNPKERGLDSGSSKDRIEVERAEVERHRQA